MSPCQGLSPPIFLGGDLTVRDSGARVSKTPLNKRKPRSKSATKVERVGDIQLGLRKGFFFSEKVSFFQIKIHFLESLERPRSVENEGESDHFLPRVCKRWFPIGGSSWVWRAHSCTPLVSKRWLEFGLENKVLHPI